MKNANNSFLLKCALIASLALNIYIYREVRNSPVSVGQSTTQTEPVRSLELSNSVSDLVKKVNDKVVSVINSQRGQRAGSGSGIIYKNNNGELLIVTNHHVVEKADQVSVQFSDGTVSEVEVVGSDQYSDLALLRAKTNLTIEPFEIGDSNKSQVGEFVITLGSPLGLSYANSVTFGIISGKDRVVPVDLNGDGRPDWDMVVTQTDAAINPGNSGGALVNMAGQLIGINSMKLSSAQVEGMGFAIPASEMVNVVEQLAAKGKIVYPMVGVSATSVEDLNGQYRNRYRVDNNLKAGVFVVEVVRGGAAEKAGLQAGDVITHINDTEIKTFNEFRRSIFTKHAGEGIKMTINRAGQVLELNATLQ